MNGVRKFATTVVLSGITALSTLPYATSAHNIILQKQTSPIPKLNTEKQRILQIPAEETQRFVVSLPNSSLTVLKGIHSFDGQSEFIKIPSQSFLNFGTGNFSISAWIKTANQRDITLIVDKRVETTGPVQGFVVYTDGGKLCLQLADGNGYANYVSSAFIADDRWHHVVITVNRQDHNGIRYFLDGNEASKPADPTGKRGSLSNSKPLVIGRRSDHPTWPGYFTGSMADIKLFRLILNPEQIEQLAKENKNNNSD